MKLAAFIESHIDPLVDEWQAFAETCVPAAGEMSESALRNCATAILHSVAGELVRPRTAGQRSRSHGPLPGISPEIAETARRHADDRLAANFTLTQLVAEYRALRASVVRMWMASSTGLDAYSIDELTRFHEAMDQSLAEAINTYFSEVERSRDMFVGILGHDLRNPLSTIAACAEIPLISNDEAITREAMDRIGRSARRMREMIDVLLDFSRIRLGHRMPLSPENGDLKALCDEIREEFAPIYRDNTLVIDCQGDLVGNWDMARINQLLSNLVKNALDYGKRRGTVTVTARRDGDDVVLAVHNEGTPISADKQKLIFEPMRRGEPMKEKRGQSQDGLGLGLYVVRQIAVAHRGSVSVTSKAEEGTTFTVRLPREALMAS